MKHVHVTCAIVERDGLVLATQRGPGMSLPGKWEFPGGKIDPGQTPADCLRRELVEELALEVRLEASLPPSTHTYPTFTVTLYPFVCSILRGTMVLLEHSAARWLARNDLPSLDWAAADIPVLTDYLAGVRCPVA